MPFTLRGVRLIDATQDLTSSSITIDDAYIQAVGDPTNAIDNTVDATGMLVTPGFIEVHTHGGGGFNLHTTVLQEIQSYARWIAGTGVTSFLIAVVGTSNALPEPQLCTAVTAIEHQQAGAEALGIHLEGPYISAKRRGAHPTDWLRIPNEQETEYILGLTKKCLRLVTLAPELPGAAKMIGRLLDAGVTVSIGHTDATYEQTQAALKLGITHATHCFNAMRPLLHREPGPVAAIAQAQHVRGELIADGVHVHPAMMDMLVRMLGPERVVVVTDAQAVAGIQDGTFEFAGQQLHIHDGAARLADGALAGSVLTMDQALRNIVALTQVTLQEAVGMLTLNPACSAGVAERKGRLAEGYDADLLILDADLTLQATICRGRLAFATPAWQARLHKSFSTL
jgi:N-acetylglucosamine-6-phosphate deacetylase